MYKHFICIFLFLFGTILVLNSISEAQNVWEKPYAEWKLDEAQKIVNKSPWAHSYTDIGVEYDSRRLNEKSLFGDVSPVFVVRLYSANTLRRGLVRMNQFGQKYDTLAAAEKLKIDEKNKPVLDCDQCKKYYILIVVQPAAPEARETLVGRKLKDIKLEDLKGRVYLMNDKKEKRELVQFVPPRSDNGYATFYFDRLDSSGRPLISDDSKKMSAVFNIDPIYKYFLGNKVEFDVSKMKIDQKVDF